MFEATNLDVKNGADVSITRRSRWSRDRGYFYVSFINQNPLFHLFELTFECD